MFPHKVGFNHRSDSKGAEDENNPHGHKDIDTDNNSENQQNGSTVVTTDQEFNNEDAHNISNYNKDETFNTNLQTLNSEDKTEISQKSEQNNKIMNNQMAIKTTKSNLIATIYKLQIQIQSNKLKFIRTQATSTQDNL